MSAATSASKADITSIVRPSDVVARVPVKGGSSVPRAGIATIGGVGLAGAFSAASGALMVQSQGFADVNMGLGILINGLAALMIGEAIVGKQSVLRQLAAPFVGAVVYYQLVSFCLAAGMPPPDLKLATGLFVLAMLALPSLKRSRGPAPARETFRE